MEKTQKEEYKAPCLDVLQVNVESGFATTGHAGDDFGYQEFNF